MRAPSSVTGGLLSHLLSTARRLGAATIYESAGRSGALPSVIRPLVDGLHLCGPAFPVALAPSNNLWLHRAIYQARPGDVLVASTGESYEAGYWGEVMTHAAICRGLAGLVIDGCVRDRRRIAALRFPVFCRGTCIRGTRKEDFRGTGFSEIQLGDTAVRIGDLVVGDGDGVVVVPRDTVSLVMKRALIRQKEEAKIIRRLRRGARTIDLYRLQGAIQ